MDLSQDHKPRAYYETDGSIVITHVPKIGNDKRKIDTHVTLSSSESSATLRYNFSPLRFVKSLNVTWMIRGVSKGIKHTVQCLRPHLRSLPARTKSILLQPVWIPGRKGEPKKYGRGVLFVLDSLRFGGTFAAIFGVLFVTLNYQSFWQIARAQLTPTIQIEGAHSLETALRDKLTRAPMLTTAGGDFMGLLAVLPPVGPPENRLIIPKLNLNVPIVSPPHDALLEERWTRLEEDIQKALKDGVVHYPGTARPGQAGNFFVTGHSSYYPWASGDYKTVFARLAELEIGDEYWVYYNGDKHRYIVQDKKEVRPSNVKVLDQPPNKRISTLMTCTPIGTTLRRLIITAQEVDPVTGLALDVGERGRESLPSVNINTLPI